MAGTMPPPDDAMSDVEASMMHALDDYVRDARRHLDGETETPADGATAVGIALLVGSDDGETLDRLIRLRRGEP